MKALTRMVALVALATAFLVNVNAADDPKSPKGKGPAVDPGDSVVMTCPKCKNDYTVTTIRAPKGSRAETAVIVTHLCQKCETKLVTKGHGKAKKDVPVHACNGCK